MSRTTSWIETPPALPAVGIGLLSRMASPGWTLGRDPSASSIVLARGDESLRLIVDARDSITLRHTVLRAVRGQITFPAGDLRDLAAEAADPDALAARIAGPLRAMLLRVPPTTEEDALLDAAVERLMRVAAAAVTGSGLSGPGIRFLEFANPWSPAGVPPADGRPVDPEWAAALEREGASLPHLVIYQSRDVSDDPEMLYDVTVRSMVLVVDRVDVVEAMRIAKDLA